MDFPIDFIILVGVPLGNWTVNLCQNFAIVLSSGLPTLPNSLSNIYVQEVEGTGVYTTNKAEFELTQKKKRRDLKRYRITFATKNFHETSRSSISRKKLSRKKG